MDGACHVTRRGNIQHGQKRRMPWSIRIPIAILVVLIPATGIALVELITALTSAGIR